MMNPVGAASMKPHLKIGRRLVGYDYPPLVVAELGINHGGDIDVAVEMVDSAHKSGAEVIKHQTHVIDDEMSSEAKKVIPGNADVSIYEIMKRCALPEDQEVRLKEYVEANGMIFLSTPFSRAAADRLERMGVTAYKIGSGELNNYPLLRHIASFRKPMILSTGMNDTASIRKAAAVMENFRVPYALLHTTNIYPTPARLVRLGAMRELENTFPNAVIGLSDHTTDNYACLAAAALGASILERHFTDSRDRTGPDIVCSMLPGELSELISGAVQIFQMRGGDKKLLDEEQVTRNFAFATVVAVKNISEGEILSPENIWVKRPGTGGIPAEGYDSLIGRRAAVNIAFDTHLKYDMLEEI